MTDTIALDRAYLPGDDAPPAAAPIHLDGFREGVFFGLDEDRYHATPALSASGIKRMLVSPMDFWARSWMAPPLEDEDDDETIAKTLGRAYHKRITEGREAFEAGYAAKLDPADYPDALRTAEDIREVLREIGEKTGGKKDDLTDRLLTADPSAQIWDRLVADHAALNDGRVLLTPRTVRRIEIAAAMIERHPELGRAFRGGVPEVSVFWVDRETGVPMKARIDYLKPRAIVDLKTYQNVREKPIDRAIAYAMASYKYHIQTAVYFEAADQIAQLAARGLVSGEAPAGFVDAVAAAEDRQFLFVWQQKGIAPVARGKLMPRNLLTYSVGKTTVHEAQLRFRECLERFGTDPWIDSSPIDSFTDEEMPAFMTE